MAKASKKRGRKKAAKRAKKSKARKSVKRAPKGAKRKPAKRKPAKRAPEPWPMIFAVLLALAVALVAGWHLNGAAEAAAMTGTAVAPAEAAADLCGHAGAKLSHVLLLGASNLN